ncbi:biotin/lipoyl-containing protein [Atribacter laminatus]|jgi:glutaconyl-CoA decarboxylase|uniref:2-oxoglutarate carboxylase large subunit n=1 Tax=Atribacter laminatus TaxID=2847778 RepID=A0A7T1AK16_ATRLM|nr:biotin/lipoyl-containing protein [Atribacter laminatus]QPM67353.1 2-oxoglutarate carboxylase large subunit [Atribacter laminatus]
MRKFKVRVNGEEFEVEVSEVNESREDGKIQVEKIKRIPREITPTNAPMQVTTVLRAPMPGRVLSVQVKKGERVSGGHVAIILEAMKMENEIQIENEGIVTQVFVEENDTVDTGDPLLECEENPRDIS